MSEQKQHNKQKTCPIRRYIFLALSILWMAVIFSFSAQPADESTEESNAVGLKIGAIVNPGFEDWTEEEQLAFAEKIDHPVRKCAHATEYALLGMLLIGALSESGPIERLVRGKALGKGIGKKSQKGKGQAIGLTALTAWILAALYATTDEIHQLFVEGRSGQFKDVCIDSAGALAGVLLISLILVLKSRKGQRIEK